MIPIQINSDDLVDSLGLSTKQARDLIDYTVKEVTARFAAEWEAEAARSLRQSREEYVKNIQVVDEGYGKGSVVLFGWLPNAIEDGYSAYDMKEGLLDGPNAKTGADGSRYNTVPYRAATPNAIGESEVFANKMPQEVYDVVKAKPATQTIAGGGKATVPLSTKELPIGHNQPKIKQVPSISPLPATWSGWYKHKAPIFQGLRRVTDPVTKQNRYQTFRRVSDNSEPESWIHPGFDQKNLAEKALDNMNIERSISQSIDSFLTKIGFFS